MFVDLINTNTILEVVDLLLLFFENTITFGYILRAIIGYTFQKNCFTIKTLFTCKLDLYIHAVFLFYNIYYHLIRPRKR